MRQSEGEEGEAAAPPDPAESGAARVTEVLHVLVFSHGPGCLQQQLQQRLMNVPTPPIHKHTGCLYNASADLPRPPVLFISPVACRAESAANSCRALQDQHMALRGGRAPTSGSYY